MRIALVTTSYPRFRGDGTAPFIQSIAVHLVKAGHHITVLAPHDPAVRPMNTFGVQLHRFRYIWPERFHVMGHGRSLQADVHLRPLVLLLLPFFLCFEFLHLYRITGQQRSQVIYAHWVLPNGLVAAWVSALRNIPFVVSLHGSDVFVAKRNRWFGCVAAWIFRRSSGVIACSPELRDIALELKAPSHSIVIPYGVDLSLFNAEYRSAEHRREFGWGPSEVIAVALGRMVYKKGFDVLLEAWALVRQRCRGEIRLVLGGDGPLRQPLQRLAEKLGIAEQVTFLGRVEWDRVPAFLANADIFILPSIRDQHGNIDGLPNVLIEAMACGMPVIASDISGVSQVLQDGYNGLMFTSGDSIQLAEAIARLVKDVERRRVLGQIGRQTVEKYLSWDTVVQQIMKYINSVTKVEQFREP
jgi:glycosyltransferase involved in cell wall biosynthesis